ncbi:MAG: hypothetical protein IKX36_06955 [Prevotella sp.]|nr:hypothetical protein [Prevotella sp.]
MKNNLSLFRTALLLLCVFAFTVNADAQKGQKKDWSGSYIADHCAGKTAGGTGICFDLSFELTKGYDDNNYVGTFAIDGFQTMVRAKVYAIVIDNELRIFYDSPEEDNFGFTEEYGTLLVTIKKGKRLIAIWGEKLIEYEFVCKATRIQ